MDKVALWKKNHKFQEKPSWCGPAVIQMALSFAEINKSQQEIAKAVCKDWWGTTEPMILAYLSQFFEEINFSNDSTLEDIVLHLDKGHIVILDWWDDINKNETPGGHYSIAADYKSGILTLADPSNDRAGIWDINANEFLSKWFDTLDVNNKIKIKGWMLWIDPKSKNT